MEAGILLRDARRRNRIDQRSLARLAGTSQAQISRIERGETSPSVSTLGRLLAAMGERLELVSMPQGSNERLSAAEAIAQAAELSYALTSIAAARRSR